MHKMIKNYSYKPVIGSNPYKALEVRPFINCCGTRTVFGGSLILPEVKEAMWAASSQFVNINELMAKARTRIAELTGAEDGIVTSGSAAAIALATAATIVGKDPVKMLRLPITIGLINNVVMLKSHRFPYDQAIRMVGANIIEVENLQQFHWLEFDTVAMIFYHGSRNVNAEIPFEEIVSIGKAKKIPILVDAASEHIERPNKWLRRGADLVAYSGGKILRGPQTSGLLLGRTDLIEAAWANSTPHRAFCRPMKIGKEDIIGVIAALEIWFSTLQSEFMDKWMNDIKMIQEVIHQSTKITCRQISPEEGDRTPRILVGWNLEDIALSGLELREHLLLGDPRIIVDDVSASTDSILLEIFSLQPGEAKIVGETILKYLSEAINLPQKESYKDNLEVENASGDWIFEVKFKRWPRILEVKLIQEGNNLFGKFHSTRFKGNVSGIIEGKEIRLFFEDSYEGTIITYQFIGNVNGDFMIGEVLLGSTSPDTRGEVSYTQYGKEIWQARKLSGLWE